MELGGVILPPELERAVFETAALLYHTQIPTLMLVAQRFHTWLQPILYRVLVSAGSKVISRRHRFPPIDDELLPERAALLQKHVRHLSIQYPYASTLADIHRLLAVFTALRGLACYCEMLDPSFIPYLDRIRPKLLCVDAENLFAGPPDFGHSLFSSITHFELLDDDISAYSDKSWKSLASLPSLTHLAFNYYSDVPMGLLNLLLEEHKRLQVLILIVVNKEILNDTDNPVSALPTHDVRFVVAACSHYLEDWIRGAWGQADLWVRADNFVRQKRRGKVPRDVYFIAEGDFADVEL
ncbi:hypothetical protein C8J57DRAFT_1470772 [Mycena rebaudengoi]|nr:hypothetical protein C8J57DRAFT_1470772 [Mycena rebaudengoi]